MTKVFVDPEADALTHAHLADADGAHAQAHTALRKHARGVSAAILLHDWGYSRMAEARHVARMHGFSVTRVREESNPMKQYYEANFLGVTPLAHHEECADSCPGN